MANGNNRRRQSVRGTRDRLRPSLLDLLRDDRPDVQRIEEGGFALRESELRERVREHLRQILSATGLYGREDLDEVVDGREEILTSVLNYGIRDFTGHSGSSLAHNNEFDVEQMLTDAIKRFEPRLLPQTVEVRVKEPEPGVERGLTVEVSADLWSDPIPQHVFLRTTIDLETGDVSMPVEGER